MGMAASIRSKDSALYAEACDEQANASAVVGGLTAISKSFRLISQSVLLGLGAYLALRGNIAGHDDCGLSFVRKGFSSNRYARG